MKQKLEVRFDPSKRPPDGIKASTSNGVLQIDLPKIPTSVAGTLFGFVFSGSFVGLRFINL